MREATGKAYVLFIIDEVGQYVSSRPNLILNLDGLAKNGPDNNGAVEREVNGRVRELCARFPIY